MREKIEIWAKTHKCEYRLYGYENYCQLFIEAGLSIRIDNISILANTMKCEVEISCMHIDELGYCLMIEFFK